MFINEKAVQEKENAMIQCRGVFTAYTVSWFPDIAYAKIATRPDDANVKYYGRYDFSNSSVAEFHCSLLTNDIGPRRSMDFDKADRNDHVVYYHLLYQEHARAQ
jgi:hypothetical protein